MHDHVVERTVLVIAHRYWKLLNHNASVSEVIMLLF
jgi:hypothetical protein